MSEGGFGLCRSWHVKYVQEQHTWSTLPLHRLSSFSTPELNAVDTFPSTRLRLRPLTSPRLVDPSSTPDPRGALVLSRPTPRPKGHVSPVANCTGGTTVAELPCFQETFNQMQFQKSDYLILALAVGPLIGGSVTTGERDPVPSL